jgi:hypothetical protein
MVSVIAAKSASKAASFTEASGMLWNVKNRLAGFPVETPALTD